MELLFLDSIIKLTALEQMLDVKNPGRNGGNGVIDSSGRWNYVKKPPKSNKKMPNSKLNYAELKQNYINYFSNTNLKLKQLYTVNNNDFSFLSYAEALKSKLVSNKNEYENLFKEQYIMYYLNKN